MVFEKGQCLYPLVLAISTLEIDYEHEVSFVKNVLATGFHFRTLLYVLGFL